MSRASHSRRDVLRAGGLLLAGLCLGAPSALASPAVEIKLRSSRDGAKAWFDPVGVAIEPGATVRWTLVDGVHTTTSYHPRNDRYALRMPEAAAPWDSGYLTEPGATYEVRFVAEGVYDYFCRPHELGGMAGRIVVGRPGGPGLLPFDYWRRGTDSPNWKAVSGPARKTLPTVDRILRERIVRAET